MQPFFALTTYGLENISAQEIRSLESVSINEVGYRRVVGQCNTSLAPLLSLRTVDDVFLSAGQWTDIAHTRDMLLRLHVASQALELDAIVVALTTIRSIRARPSFSVTASFVGNRNYSANEIKLAVSEGIVKRYSWTYAEDDRSADLNIRVFIEHSTAYVGVRLGKHPLHERAYKRAQRPGSLKPSVAAAMLLMADIRPGMQILDPCCGTGTILIEAALIGAITQGGDNAPEAVEAARANVQQAGVSTQIELWDARQLPLPSAVVDCVITNLPWGQQVKVDETTSQFYTAVCGEIERVLRSDGRTVVLTNMPEQFAFHNLAQEKAVEISLFGQRPSIAVFTRRITHPHSAPGVPVE
jgi:23S rRNA G2445 N2-methylase RlmL